MLRSSNRWVTALRLVAFATAATLFAVVFFAADVGRVSELVGAIGLAGSVVVLLPQAAALVTESYGWKLALRVMGHEVGLVPLLRVRVATEALSQTLPAGVLFGESAKPFLLVRHCALSMNEGIAALVARKVLLLVSQAFYVLVVATLGFGVLRSASLGILGSGGLEWVAYGVGGCLLALAIAAAAWLRQSAVAHRLFGALKKLPLRALSRWLDASERRFRETDRSVSAFFQQGADRHAVPAFWFALGWLIESAETYLVLRLLGVDVGFVEVASIEVLLTFVRHVVFVVPAGLGVQDIGYVAAFAALGIPDASSVGAAFVILKRTKELVWIALGYALLALEARDAGRTLTTRTVRFP